MKKAKLPEGYSEDRIAAMSAHYDSQTEEESLAEDQAAWGDKSLAWMQVPTELVPAVSEFIRKRSKAVPGKVAESGHEYGENKA